MRLWPFKRKDPPEPEDDPDEPVEIIATPFAALVCQMLTWACPPHVIVWVVQQVETERARTAARVRAEMSLPAARTVPHVTKPQVVTNKPVKRTCGRKKRNRTNYMRDYRAKLRVVTNNDGDAA
jgi:hypothetical protein